MKLPEFDDCLKKGRIVSFPAAKQLVNKEFEAAKQDLASAQKSLEDQNSKWATSQAYYAMFHAARALLYLKGYREKSHYCLMLAMKEFYVSEGKLEMRLAESLQMAKAMRQSADYENIFDQASAVSLVRQAALFVNATEIIIIGSRFHCNDSSLHK